MTHNVILVSRKHLILNTAIQLFIYDAEGTAAGFLSFPFFNFLSSLFHSLPFSPTAIQPLIKRRQLLLCSQFCLKGGTLVGGAKFRTERNSGRAGHLAVKTQRPCGSGPSTPFFLTSVNLRPFPSFSPASVLTCVLMQRSPAFVAPGTGAPVRI